MQLPDGLLEPSTEFVDVTPVIDETALYGRHTQAFLDGLIHRLSAGIQHRVEFG
jgi:hypothetical protein